MTDNKEQQECKVCGKTLNPHDIAYGYHQCIIEQPITDDYKTMWEDLIIANASLINERDVYFEKIQELESLRVKDIEDAWDASRLRLEWVNIDTVKRLMTEPPDKASYLKQFTGK